jgi:tetraacyldisaccharide 4'-kinase
VPVIVVGNVIAGGAGKTPVVIEIARFLQSAGYKPGIVSRGYGRKSKGLVQVNADTPIADSGDEPALIHAATGLPVVVAADRAEAASALLAVHPQVNLILSDDGLQHLALQRDIEIIVFDERGIGNGRLLPAGPLREAWPRQADFVLHRGGPQAARLAQTASNSYAIQRELADHALRADGSAIALQSLAQSDGDFDGKLIALAGIAQPESFFSMLKAQGLRLTETIALPDHYDFDSWKRRFHAGQTLICTEKDAVKLRRSAWAQELQILAVPLQLSLPEQFTQALLSSLHGLETA